MLVKIFIDFSIFYIQRQWHYRLMVGDAIVLHINLDRRSILNLHFGITRKSIFRNKIH